MPELPEVETTKTSLKPLLNKRVAKVSVYQPKLRWPIPDDLSSLEGYTLKHIDRRAKYLILTFVQYDITQPDPYPVKQPNSEQSPLASPTQRSIIIHLGMSGSLQQFPVGTPKRKHDHLIINYFASNDTTNDSDNEIEPIQLHYHDPRRFGSVLWFEDYADKLFNHLGVEPLDEAFTGDYLYNKIHRVTENKTAKTQNKRLLSPITRPIKAVIMDQVYVVGVGNIYATESLFYSHIHPSTPANALSKSQLLTLTDHIRAILKRAIEQGGSTLRDFTVASGTTGYFQQTLNVYGRHKQACPKCQTKIDKVIITGRASTFCTQCQPK